MDLLAEAEAIVKRAIAMGADEAEAYVARSRSMGVTAAGRTVSTSASEDSGLAVRVFVDGRVGFAGARDPEAVERAIGKAIAAARGASAAPAVQLAKPRPATHAEALRGLFEDETGERSLDLAQSLVDEALARPAVSYTQTLIRRNVCDLAVANSTGLGVVDRSGAGFIDVEVRVSRGTTHRTTRATIPDVNEELERLQPAPLIDRLVARVTSALDPIPLPSGKVDQIIFQPIPASQVIGLVGPAFCGLSLVSGKSPLAGKLGELLFSPSVTLRDNPHGRRIYDDEGTPTSMLPLVEKGVLVGFAYDAKTATAAGVASTGNGYRGGMSSAPSPRLVRPDLAPSGATLDEVIAQTDRAVLVTDPLLGAFASDKVTAEFSVVAPYAFYVENGKIRHALPPTTIGGNSHAVLRSVRAVANDATACLSATTPTFLAGGVSCAT